MTSMPHVLEKGRLFSALEQRYNAMSPTQRMAALDHLYQSDLVVPNANEATVSGYAPTLSKQTNIDHLNGDWFGLPWSNAGGGGWTNGPSPTATTGGWNGWYGDAHQIFRVTLVRALEVSLGLTHNAKNYNQIGNGTASAGATWPAHRWHWPLSFLWVCGSPLFEGWVQWRRVGDGAPPAGLVTVVFTTPGPSWSPMTRKLRPPALDALGNDLLSNDPNDGYVDNPQNAYGPAVGEPSETGLWVIGHDATVELATDVQPWSTLPEAAGNWQFFPSAHAVLSGSLLSSAVVVVEPAEDDGGARRVLPTWQSNSY